MAPLHYSVTSSLQRKPAGRLHHLGVQRLLILFRIAQFRAIFFDLLTLQVYICVVLV